MPPVPSQPPQGEPPAVKEADVSSAVKEARDSFRDLAGLAQKTWFSLLTILGFFAIVIMSTTDADFLVNTKTTMVPLLQVAVPTERFFFAVPIVTTLLYCYLHYLCMRLWPLTKYIQGSDISADRGLIAGLARYFEPAIRSPGGPDAARVAGVVTGLLLWLSHPLLLCLALMRSEAASRMEWLSPQTYPHLSLIIPSTVESTILLCLAVSLAVGTASLLAALSARFRGLGRSHVMIGAISLAVLAPFIQEWLQGGLRGINADGENLTHIDADWPEAWVARELYLTQWCASRGISVPTCLRIRSPDGASPYLATERPLPECGGVSASKPSLCRRYLTDLTEAFHQDWTKQRKAELRHLPSLNLSQRDFSRASLRHAILINAQIEQAILREADVAYGKFEGATLVGSNLSGMVAYYADFARSNLTDADLSYTNLTSTILEDAQLPGATLTGASLISADLGHADLRNANLAGADLSNTVLSHADLTDATLDGAILDGAVLTDAIGLKPDQLRSAVRNAATVLPARLEVQRCWNELPKAALDVIDAAPGGQSQDRMRDVLGQRLCSRNAVPFVPTAPMARAAPDRAEATLVYIRERDREMSAVREAWSQKERTPDATQTAASTP